MLIQYHISITRQALEKQFSPCAMEAILKANIKQDDLLTGQIGHDEYHYDNNAIAKSNAYLEEQRALTISAMKENGLLAAWAAFGRLIHTAQDFYAHSNYVDLWLSRFPNGDNVEGKSPPPPPEIVPLMDELIHSPDLHSGKLYYPLEVLSFIPILKHLVMPHLPADSHAHMHLDYPARGQRFDYAFEAAVQRTKVEYEQIILNFTEEQKKLFLDN